ncbi:MAG TPA: UDP-N-acetylglucosamine 2-epimerase, partial [Candidatus Omnitrophota bacterium]|nr:UDP-N-acetylglucosamine 2-epimerase [Candidatus Omnitrophota bacterium]
MKRKIAVFTGNRAEYGMLKPILKEIALNKKLSYQLIVSGAHLDKKFGRTIGEIKGDGFVIAGKVDITSTGDSLFDTTQAIGKGIISLGKLLKMLKPDLFLVYADRFESFAALIASTQMGIPT